MSMLQNFWNGGQSWRTKHGAPRNRRELFLCVLSDQLFSVVFLNIFYGIFYLPAVIWSIANLLRAFAALEGGDAVTAAAAMNTLFIGLVPCITITGPARAGMAKVMRNWAREEASPAMALFWSGWRDNWKQALIPALITAVFPLILWSAWQVSARSGFAGVFPVLMAIATIAFLLWLLAQQIVYVLLVTYDLPMKGHLRNTLLLTVLRLPQAALVFLGSMVAWIIYFLFIWIRPAMYVAILIIPILYYAFIGWCLTDLIHACYANYICDEYLNGSAEAAEDDAEG